MSKEAAESQEFLQRAIFLRDESEEIEKQLQFVTEQINELQQFLDGLALLNKDEEGDVLASIGKGVHMKVERKKDEKFFVEVGAGVVVRKTLEETEKVVRSQVSKFQEAKLQLTAKLQENAKEFRKMLEEIEKFKTH